MIKIIARAEINGANKSSSFSSKQNRVITKEDLKRIDKFITNALINGSRVILSYKITHDNIKSAPIYISSVSSSAHFVYLNKKDIQLKDIISSINREVTK